MNADSKNRTHSTDTTSTTRLDPELSRLSESEFLARQAEEAQKAIRAKIERIEQTLKDSADLQAWTREYPWASVGAAALAGFVAAAAITPTSSSRQKKEWTALLRELLAEAEEKEGHAPGETQHGSMLGGALSGLLKTFGTALQSSIIAAATAKAQQPSDTASSNGHHESAMP